MKADGKRKGNIRDHFAAPAEQSGMPVLKLEEGSAFMESIKT
jgi:hypothetical protein